MSNELEIRADEPSIEECRAAIKLLFPPDAVIELRGLGIKGVTAPKKFTLTGFYDDHEKLATDAIRVSNAAGILGTYFTLQPLNPALLSRSPNRYHIAGAGDCAADSDVTAYRWLPLDFDPVRAAGISSTDEEKAAAIAVMRNVAAYLKDLYIHSVVPGDSGNGAHLLVRVDLKIEAKPLVARVLAALAYRFSTDAVTVDEGVFNPARIWKFYGTMARKGFATADRPHRISRILDYSEYPEFGDLKPVNREVLEHIASTAPEQPERKAGKKVTAGDLSELVSKLEDFMVAGKIEHGGRMVYKDGFKWQLDQCPFNPEHRAPDSIVTLGPDGALGFRCLHNSCLGFHWSEFRAAVEKTIGKPFEFVEKAPPIDPSHIVTNPGHLVEMIRRSEGVLFSYGLKYFERNSQLVNTKYSRDLPNVEGIERAGDSIVIQPASGETIMRDLDSKATYVYLTPTKDGETEKVVQVPKNLPYQIHDRVNSQPREVPFDTLELVTGAPVLLRSGNIHRRLMPSESEQQEGGVFEEGVMFVQAHTNRYGTIKEYPTKDDAFAALKLFEPIFCDFPFVDPAESETEPDKKTEWNLTASYAVALAGVLSLVARPYMGTDAIPIIGCTAPTRRSGKTKIIEAAATAALGHRPTACHFTDEVEFDKHLQPLMLAGDRAILIDNVERSLQSSKLCIVITGGVLRDRILGESRDVILKNYSVLFSSGNNLVFGGDLSSRAIRCDINPKLERPEARAFDFDPVERARERHPQLVMAALTMLRAYLFAGMPWGLERKPWGGFNRWDKLVCGCLTWLGTADPVLSRDRIINADPVRMSNIDVLEDWYARFAEKTTSFNDIRDAKGPVYDSLLKNGQWNGYHARWILQKLEGQTIGGFRLERLKGRSLYRVLREGSQISLPTEDEHSPF